MLTGRWTRCQRGRCALRRLERVAIARIRRTGSLSAPRLRRARGPASRARRATQKPSCWKAPRRECCASDSPCPGSSGPPGRARGPSYASPEDLLPGRWPRKPRADVFSICRPALWRVSPTSEPPTRPSFRGRISRRSRAVRAIEDRLQRRQLFHARIPPICCRSPPAFVTRANGTGKTSLRETPPHPAAARRGGAAVLVLARREIRFSFAIFSADSPIERPECTGDWLALGQLRNTKSPNTRLFRYGLCAGKTQQAARVLPGEEHRTSASSEPAGDHDSARPTQSSLAVRDRRLEDAQASD